MKHNVIRVLMTICLLCALMIPVFAERYPSEPGWTVTFTSAGKLEPNFKASDFNDPVSMLQPGDQVDFTVSVIHSYDQASAWYMTNEVAKSLEEAHNATDGAYSYLLTYSGPGGDKTLYDSKKLGGRGVDDGLEEANAFLEEDIFLDNLTKGQSGEVTLTVTLEGESQINSYQDAEAIVLLDFAVEPTAATPVSPAVSPTPTPRTTTVVKTGDETNMVPLLVAMGISGLILLALAIYGVNARKKMGKGGA